MADFGKINLAAMASHRIMEFPVAGSTEKIECLVLPLKKNSLFKSEKGNVYLDIVLFEMKEPQKDKDGAVTQTHIIKQSLPKEVRAAMSDAEKLAQPILGGVAVNVYQAQGERPATQDTSFTPSENDLPF